MIDFHNHLVPGVDDGASDLDQSRTALRTLREQGVRAVVVTPHLKGSVTERPAELAAELARLDAGWAQFQELGAAEFPEMRLERGVELMLDSVAPVLSDPRLRLAGTPFVLVEFPFMNVPPNAGTVLFDLAMAGWTPVIAHPERYGNLDAKLAGVAEWRRAGALLQVNAGSLLGRYGSREKAVAWELLGRGMVSYISSDYHARGRCAVADCRLALEQAGGSAQATLLTETNPERLLAGSPPLSVAPLSESRSLWSRIWGKRQR